MTKTKAGVYIILATICCVLSAGLAAAQTLEWSPEQQYDDGINPSVAVHPSGLVLEFHQSSLGITDIWYHVGMLNGTSVTWGGSQSLGQKGNWATVAISKEGFVILVRSTTHFKNGGDLRYWVGKIDPFGGINQSIDWLVRDAFWDAGFHASIAINDNGLIVGVHEAGFNSNEMYYRVGHLLDPAAGKYTMAWDSGSYGIHYDDGINPHISLNTRNEVVEVHQVPGERLLHYFRGTVSGGTINFASSQRYDDVTERPAVALTDDGFAVEVHGGVAGRAGMLSLFDPARIEWGYATRISTKDGTYPAVATNGTYIVATWIHHYDITEYLYYSVATIP
jgi:hypothetical protein